MDSFNIIKYVYSQQPNDNKEVEGKWVLFADALKDNFIWSVSILTMITIIIYGWYYWRQWVIRGYERASLLSLNAEANRLRFRKRDKMLFYGRRMLRKVKNTGQAVYGGQGRKRRAVMRFAKRILQLKRESAPMQLKTVEPPAEYLEEMVEGSDRVPPDALYMLQGIRIFGHFEKPIFLKLCRHTEIINLEINDLLFKIGDIDDSVFIVQSGMLNVLINNADGSTLSLKLVKKGESVTSLLSFIDVLNGNASVYKSVTAKAVEKSTVIRLPMDAFKEIFEESPDKLIRVIQVIMIRLQRVTFTALRNYLGLSAELVQNKPKRGSIILKQSPVTKQFQDLATVHSLSTETLPTRPDMLADLSDSNASFLGHSRKPSANFDQTDEPTLYSIAIEGLMKELGLKESEKKLLETHIELREAHPGVTILTEGKNEDVCLIYILSGSLTLLQQGSSIPGSKNKTDAEVHSHNAYPGEMIGGLAVLTGESSLYTVRAKHYSRIALLKRNTIYSIMRVKPTIVLDIANTVVRRLSPLVRQCDYALDWIFLESGRAVYRQDEIGDSTYIVLSGRLRSVVTQANGKKEIVGEYGKGDMVGIVEMITETSRTTTALAVRDSELAKLPEGLFNAIKIKYPVVVTKLIRLLSHRILVAGSMQSKPGGTPLEANPVTHKYSTVALVPVSEDVPLTAFTYELYHSLCALGPSLRLTSDVVRKSLGVSILEPNYEYRLTSWLAQQEDRNIITLYQCDYNLSAWTQRCMRQADVIIIVGLGDRAPTVGKFEKEIDKMALRTQKELVLLHREAANKPPVNTLQWLNVRPWVTNHHHIQCAKRMFTRKSQYGILSKHIQTGYERASLLSLNAEANRLRFRKRDKMLFYGRRMLRKVKNTGQAVYGGQGRKRRAVMRFAKRILQLKRESAPMQLKTVEPPAEYLEEMVEGSDRVPPDALYMLQGIRIFGHFEKPIFLKLCRHTEIINLEINDLLFKIGDIDDSVFIVQSGMLNVLINNADGSTLSLKLVKKGESVTSLLSFIDVLNGNASVYKSVTAKAVEKSTVIRLPMDAFKEIFEESPDKLIRVIQVIMIRLQRVTFTALRNYLGLSAELVQNKPKRGSIILKQSPVTKQFQDLATVHSLSTETLPTRPDMLADLSDSNASFLGHSRKPSANFDQTDEPTLYSIAIEGLMKELGLKESEKKLLETHIELREAHPGVTILTEGKNEDVCLIYILSGSLTLLQQGSSIPGSKNKTDAEVHSHNAYPGEMIGGLAVLTGESSLYTVRAKHYSRIALLKRNTIYSIMRVKPTIVLDIANTVVRRLSPLVRQCDYALDWIFLESGRAVYRQDEIGDSTYIVLSGRLRSVVTQANGKKEIVGEYGKGDMVGIVEMITETSRTTTALAVRDSELAKLPEGLFNAIKIKYPVVVTKLIRLLSHRILVAGSMQSKPGGTPLEANPVTHKYSTVALVPVSEDVPLTAFTYELYHSLCALGPSLRLTSDVVRKSLGVSILEPNYEYRLTSWLAQQEDRNIITLYQCDYNLSAWTQRCMRQADVIIIVGLGDRAPTVGKFEKEIDKMALRTQKELVLLHREAANKPPVNTLQWLNVRPWVTNHHHIQCAKRMFTRKSQYRINDLYSKVLMSEPNMHSDFSRLARWLTGNSVGLVLGGGGARGAAHVGTLKSIQEAGIPIDMVGGVSIGAFMGALWCAERNIATVTQKAREWSKKMTQWHRQILDLTYPITSMFSGRGFNETIRDTFGDVYIEDLWTPYFTLTTDITASTCRVHTNGSLWRFVRASMSLSGYMPPLCDPKDGHLLLDGGYVNNLPGSLWRFVRASMSVAGIFPPICDYTDGHLLVDGCYTNNVPADVMHNLGAAHIIAVDVGSQDDTDLTDYGDDLSGWWLLYKKWNPFTTPVKVPNLPDIQSRLAYVSCVRQLEEVKNSSYCEYIRPPIDKYKTLAFGSFDEIKEVGYVHGRNCFDMMAKSGRLGRFNQWFSKELPKKHSHSLNEYTFIDLAQIVCKLPETRHEKIDSSSSSDEEYDGYISEPTTLNRNVSMRILKRGTGSLSLSENEMDSDEFEYPTRLSLKRSETTSSLLNEPLSSTENLADSN